jgi:hypothetical protein
MQLTVNSALVCRNSFGPSSCKNDYVSHQRLEAETSTFPHRCPDLVGQNHASYVTPSRDSCAVSGPLLGSVLARRIRISISPCTSDRNLFLRKQLACYREQRVETILRLGGQKRGSGKLSQGIYGFLTGALPFAFVNDNVLYHSKLLWQVVAVPAFL